MPNTFLARFLAEQITVERRLSAVWAGLIARLQTLVERYARMNPTAITWEPVTADVGYPIAPALREQFLHDADRELLTFYGARDPYRLVNDKVIPTSELMRALWPSLVAAGKLGFERQTAIIASKLKNHPALWAAYQPIWNRKTARIVREQGGGGRPEAQYDPPHLWVDPNGYRLSDRIWATSEEDRRKLHLFMNDAINQGTGSATLAKQLEQFLLPGKQLPSTNKPYGRDLSYNAMRLARTEIASAYNRADHAAAIANPFVRQYNVRLSRSHPKLDVCDEAADSGPHEMDDTQWMPPLHPLCLCTFEWIVDAPLDDVIAQMRAEIAAEFPDKILPSGALDLRGVRLPEVGVRVSPGGLSGAWEEVPLGVPKTFEQIPIETSLSTISDTFLNEHKEYIANLPSKQREAIVEYTGDGYKDVNNYLRNGILDKDSELYSLYDKTSEKRLKSTIKNLEKIFENAPRTESPLKLYRGAGDGNAIKPIDKSIPFQPRNRPGIRNIPDERLDTLVGQEILDRGFVSTGIRQEWASDIQLVIDVPIGTPVLELTSISSGEGEILLPSNARFKITRTAIEIVNGERSRVLYVDLLPYE